MVIDEITSTVLDIPLACPITMSFGEVSRQTTVLVRARCSDGVVGCGEADLLGGPHWGVESAESVKATIDRYIAPALIRQRFSGAEAISSALGKTIKGNAAARGSVEMALLDILGRRLGLPASTLFGGALRDRLPVAWTLSNGATALDIEDGERAIEERGHRQFKLKIGVAHDPTCEYKRVCEICRAFEGRALITADINQGWDTITARKWLPAFADVGLHAIEQPLPAWDIDGMARIQALLDIPVVADEAITGLRTAQRVVQSKAAYAISLKPNRDGGMWTTRKIAAVAEASGIGLYGGTMIETSLGTAALAMLYSAVPQLALGTELFGPLRLAGDIAATPLVVRDGALDVPTGPGFGIELDMEQVRFFTRND